MSWLYQQSGSPYWYLADRINGKPARWSTKKSDRKEADKVKAVYDAMKAAKAAGRLSEGFYQALADKPLSNVTLKAALDDWLKECHNSTSKGTYERYSNVYDAMVASLDANDRTPLLRDVSTQDVYGLLCEVRKTRSADTTNLYRRIVAGFFIRCIKNGLLKDNPVLSIKKFKAGKSEKTKRRTFTESELSDIYKHCKTDFWRYMVIGGYYTGLRMGDLIIIKVGSVNFTTNLIKLTAGKTGRDTVLPMGTPLRDLLYRIVKQLTNGNAGEYIWKKEAQLYLERGARAFSPQFHNILAAAELVDRRLHRATKKKRKTQHQTSEISFHCLRHTLNSALQNTGSTKGIAKELLGHSDDRVNDGYTHIPVKVLADAIGKIPNPF